MCRQANRNQYQFSILLENVKNTLCKSIGSIWIKLIFIYLLYDDLSIEIVKNFLRFRSSFLLSTHIRVEKVMFLSHNFEMKILIYTFWVSWIQKSHFSGWSVCMCMCCLCVCYHHNSKINYNRNFKFGILHLYQM